MPVMSELMAQAADEMRNSLRRTRTALSHNLSRGESTEEAFRTFLRDHLPPSLGVTKGQIIDSTGQRSRQADVIVYDRDRTPMLFTSEEQQQQVVPSEGVLAVFEVKTRVERSDLADIVQHMQSVKDLDKSAYFEHGEIILTNTTLYGREFPNPPTMYFLFAFDSGELAPLVERLDELQAALPISKRIDCGGVLNRGVLLNASLDARLEGAPSPGSKLRPLDTDKALLWFYMLFARYLLQMRVSPINLLRYV